jgi:hypothetical protein
VVQHPDLVSLPLGPPSSLCLPHTLHNFQSKTASVKVFAKFKQNLTQMRGSSRFFVFQSAKTAKDTGDRFTLLLVLNA